MAKVVIDVAAEFTGKQAFDKANKSTINLEKSVKRLGRNLGIALSTTAVVNFGKASAKAFAADDAAAKSLGQTLKNLGLAYGANVGTVNGFISRLEAQTGVLDDELRPAMDRLLRATGDVAQSQELLNLALDISAGTGKSVTQVSQSLQKAYLGQNQALGRLGVGLSKAELTSSNFEEIQARLNVLFAGQAVQAADSYQGSLNKLTVAANNAKETIGKGIIDALSGFSGKQGVGGAVTAIDKLATGVSSTITGIGYLAQKVEYAKPILVGAGVAIMLAWAPWFTAITAAAALVGFIGNALKKNAGFQGMGNVPMTGGSNMDTQKYAEQQKKLAAARIRAEKLAAAAKVKADKDAAANAAKLAKAQSIFDIDKIQIEAALKGKISDEEKLRLELQRAILNEDFDLANKLQKQLEASQRATAALKGQIGDIKPPVNPFAEMLTSLEAIAVLLGKTSGSNAITTRKPGGGVLPVEPEDLIPEVVVPKEKETNKKEIPVIVTELPPEPPATNIPSAGAGGDTSFYGGALPWYMRSSSATTPPPVTVNVTVEGSVISQNEMTKIVADALIVADTEGLSTKRPGGVGVMVDSG
jgi:hypothetical protein